eukprot:g37022.t1
MTNSAQQNGTTSATDRQNGTSDRYGQTSSRRTGPNGYVQPAYVQPSLPTRNYRETRNGYSSPLRTTHRTDITGHPSGTRTLPASGSNAKRFREFTLVVSYRLQPRLPTLCITAPCT